MNVQASQCDPQRIEAFVGGRLSDLELASLEEHLGGCATCRESLYAHSADKNFWKKTGRYLRDDDAELSFLSGTQGCLPERDSSHTIQQVLDALAPTDDPEMLGRLGAYEVSGVVGAGGMGVVLKAFDRSLDRPVAIKVLAPHLASSGAARKRFGREAKAAAAVLHPNVMAVHGVSHDESLPYLVMPYLRGVSLQSRMDDEGPLPVCDILRIASQTANGLAAAHAQGLVHRDIKPANILLENGVERVAITDFGLARAVDDATMTRTGVIAGTPQYMSPEQARGEVVDQNSDLFSLGGVLYALCTGRPPFRAETSYGVLRRITDTEPRPIREINPEVPKWLCDIIAKLMAKQPEDRFESATEVAGLLEECLAHVQQPTAVSLPRRCRSLRSSSTIADPKATVFRRWPPFKSLLATAFAFFVILAGILFVVEWNKGTLTIECEADGVPVKIMQGEKVVEKFTVTRTGTSVRVAAGKYVVEIDGETDGITIQGGSVQIQRRGQRIVRIVLDKAPRAADSPTQDQSPPARHARRHSYMLEFSGRQTYVDITGLRYDGSHPITLEATVMSLHRGSIIADFSGSGLGLDVADGFCSFHVNDGRQADNGYVRVKSRRSVGHNKLVHVAGVLNGRKLSLFVDGKLQGSETIGKFNQSNFPFMIGADPGGQGEPTQFLNGFIDQVRVSKTARYDEDFAPPSKLESDKHTLVLYRLDEGEGDVANDSSGNALHAKIHSPKWFIAKAKPARKPAVNYPKYGEAAELMRWSATLDSSGEHVHVKLDDEGRVTSVHMGGGDITDEGLRHLRELKDVENLTLSYTYGCTAEGLKHVQQMTKVKFLRLWGNYNFSDGVGYLSGMTNVESLYLHKLRVTDQNMKFVKGMKGCKFIQMTLNPTVTDAGIAHLAGLVELESIYLTCPQLTDECLKYFHDMHKLNSLLIASPHMTNAALRRLSKTLPNLRKVNNEPVEKLFENNSKEKPADGEANADPKSDSKIALNPRPQRILGFVPGIEEVKRDKQAKLPASHWQNALEEIRKGMAKKFPKMVLKPDYRGEHGLQHMIYRHGGDAILVTLKHCKTPHEAGESLRLTDQHMAVRTTADIRVKGIGDEAYVYGTPERTGTFIMCYSNIYVLINSNTGDLQTTAARVIETALETVAQEHASNAETAGEKRAIDTDDSTNLQGDWKLLFEVKGGRREEVPGDVVLTFGKNTVLLGGSRIPPNPLLAGTRTFSLDDKSRPKKLVMTYKEPSWVKPVPDLAAPVPPKDPELRERFEERLLKSPFDLDAWLSGWMVPRAEFAYSLEGDKLTLCCHSEFVERKGQVFKAADSLATEKDDKRIMWVLKREVTPEE